MNIELSDAQTDLLHELVWQGSLQKGKTQNHRRLRLLSVKLKAALIQVKNNQQSSLLKYLTSLYPAWSPPSQSILPLQTNQ